MRASIQHWLALAAICLSLPLAAEEVTRIEIDGTSFHFYTLPTGEWQDKGEATGFGEDQWIATLRQTLRMEEFIRNNKGAG